MTCVPIFQAIRKKLDGLSGIDHEIADVIHKMSLLLGGEAIFL